MSESSKILSSKSDVAPPDLGPGPARTPGVTPDFIVVGESGEGSDDVDATESGPDGPVIEPQPQDRLARRHPSQLSSRVEAAIVRVGRSWLHNEEIVGQWVREARSIAGDLEQDLASGELGAVAEGVRRVTEVLAWLDAAAQESARRARRASRGLERRDTGALVRDAAKRIHAVWDEVDIQLPPLSTYRADCRPGALSQAFGLALEAILRRIGGRGSIEIEIEEGALYVLHHFRGVPVDDSERPGEAIPQQIAQRLRHLVVDIHGGRLFPGPAGAGAIVLTVAIPRADLPELRS